MNTKTEEVSFKLSADMYLRVSDALDGGSVQLPHGNDDALVGFGITPALSVRFEVNEHTTFSNVLMA